MNNNNIPVVIQQLISDLLDKKVSVYTRVNYRPRIDEISKALNKALEQFDKEYANANSTPSAKKR